MKYSTKDIPGYEKRYRINSYGVIFSYPKQNNQGFIHKGLFLQPRKNETRYVIVTLRKNHKTKIEKVHRLVAKTFLPNPKNKRCVNHKDGNKENNFVGNLEWCNHSENLIHSYNFGLRENCREASRKTGIKNRKISLELAERIRDLYSTGKYKQAQIGRDFSISKDSVWNIVHFKTY